MCKRDRRAIKALLVIVLLFFMVWFSIPMTATRVTGSVVMVRIYSNNYQKGSASGVVVGDGIILTAKHVIDDADKVIIQTDQNIRITSINLIEADDTDLGLIIIDPNNIIPKSRLSFCETFIGQRVFGIGSRFGLFNSFFDGVVGAKGRLSSFFGGKKLLQLDMAGNPGDSGCPIYNRWGHIVGIIIGTPNRYGDGVSYAVPARICRLFLKQYEADKNMKEAK